MAKKPNRYFLTGLIHAVTVSLLAMSLPAKKISSMRFVGYAVPTRVSRGRNSGVAAAKRRKQKAKHK